VRYRMIEGRGMRDEGKGEKARTLPLCAS